MRVVILATTYQLLSGGDVIFAEFAKNWKKIGHNISIITNEKGRFFCESRGIGTQEVTTWKNSFTDIAGPYLSGIYKTFSSTINSILFSKKVDLLFMSSSFLPDIFAGMFIKLKNPHCKVVACQYVTFPSPLQRHEHGSSFLRSTVLYLTQELGFAIYRLICNLMLTASEMDKKLITEKNSKVFRVFALRGGVDVDLINKIKSQQKTFDAVYFGRLHQRKGLLDLLDVWCDVLNHHSDAKLLLLGGGPQEEELRSRAKHLSIDRSITFTGITDGTRKYKLLKSARIFVSASTIDTGNIALDESLACRVPGVIYDLPHLHYPSGVIKIEPRNKKQLSKAIIKLLSDPRQIQKLGREGNRFVCRYDWKEISKSVLDQLENL